MATDSTPLPEVNNAGRTLVDILLTLKAAGIDILSLNAEHSVGPVKRCSSKKLSTKKHIAGDLVQPVGRCGSKKLSSSKKVTGGVLVGPVTRGSSSKLIGNVLGVYVPMKQR